MSWEAPPPIVTLTVTMPRPKAFILDPRTTALIVIDMQNTALKPNQRFPEYPDRVRRVIPGNARLLDKARQAGAEVIFVQSVRRIDGPEVVRYGRKPHLLVGSHEVEIMPELAPLPSEPVVQKWSTDAFARTELDDLLAAKGIVPADWTVIVSGVSASGCQHACTLGVSNRHYMTLVPLDAVAAQSLEYEARAFAQHLSPSYDFNVAFTHSEMITFEHGAPPVEQQLEALTYA